MSGNQFVARVTKPTPMVLIVHLYAFEAARLASTNDINKQAYNANLQFQVDVVTFLQFCGGLPGTVETLNVPRETDWPLFSTHLTNLTANWQSKLLK